MPTDLRRSVPQEAGGQWTRTWEMRVTVTGNSTQPAVLAAKKIRDPDDQLFRAGRTIRWSTHPVDSLLDDRSNRYPEGRAPSAVYGADAVPGGQLSSLIHKFRGLEIGGTYGKHHIAEATNEW